MSNINDRVKMIRKSDKLNADGKMTMERFGSRLGVSKASISNIENGTRDLTNQMFISICREFDVNPDWLRDGTGEMFIEKTRNDEITDFINDILKNEPDGIRARLIAALSRLDNRDWDRIAEVARTLAAEQSAEDAAAASDEKEREKLHAELDRQLDLEKDTASEASGSTA